MGSMCADRSSHPAVVRFSRAHFPLFRGTCFLAMPLVSVMIHPSGLHPVEAFKAHHKHSEEGMSLDQIIEEGEVRNLSGEVTGRFALWSAIQRVAAVKTGDLVPTTRYHNCGRTAVLFEEDGLAVLEFVQKWRHKRFCTCRYIKHTLKLHAPRRTINRHLNANGLFWKKVPKFQKLSAEQLRQRRAWVEKYASRTPQWWQEHLHMVLDGVTLTMAPKPRNGREKHAAQRITSMWMKRGEALDNELHTFNRYGVQLGTKVPLWGGFSGNGECTLRLWTPKPKMTAEEWAALIPDVKAAISDAYGDDMPRRPWVWHENERFLVNNLQEYRRNGLELHRFPPNSGDLNRVETVWAWLRNDLAQREQQDLRNGRYLSAQQFGQRCAQILRTYVQDDGKGDGLCRLQRLARGMPKRLRKCNANSYGRCGK